MPGGLRTIVCSRAGRQAACWRIACHECIDQATAPTRRTSPFEAGSAGLRAPDGAIFGSKGLVLVAEAALAAAGLLVYLTRPAVLPEPG